MKPLFKYAIAVLGFLHFAFALILPRIKGEYLLLGTDFEKLERDPITAAICAGVVLCAMLYSWSVMKNGDVIDNRRGRWITILALVVAGLVLYRGHPYSALILLVLTSLLFRRK